MDLYHVTTDGAAVVNVFTISVNPWGKCGFLTLSFLLEGVIEYIFALPFIIISSHKDWVDYRK